MSKGENPKDKLAGIEEDLDSAMADLNATNTRIDDLLAGLDAGESLEEAIGPVEDAKSPDEPAGQDSENAGGRENDATSG